MKITIDFTKFSNWFFVQCKDFPGLSILYYKYTSDEITNKFECEIENTTYVVLVGSNHHLYYINGMGSIRIFNINDINVKWEFQTVSFDYIKNKYEENTISPTIKKKKLHHNIIDKNQEIEIIIDKQLYENFHYIELYDKFMGFAFYKRSNHDLKSRLIRITDLNLGIKNAILNEDGYLYKVIGKNQFEKILTNKNQFIKWKILE